MSPQSESTNPPTVDAAPTRLTFRQNHLLIDTFQDVGELREGVLRVVKQQETLHPEEGMQAKAEVQFKAAQARVARDYVAIVHQNFHNKPRVRDIEREVTQAGWNVSDKNNLHALKAAMVGVDHRAPDFVDVVTEKLKVAAALHPALPNSRRAFPEASNPAWRELVTYQGFRREMDKVLVNFGEDYVHPHSRRDPMFEGKLDHSLLSYARRLYDARSQIFAPYAQAQKLPDLSHFEKAHKHSAQDLVTQPADHQLFGVATRVVAAVAHHIREGEERAGRVFPAPSATPSSRTHPALPRTSLDLLISARWILQTGQDMEPLVTAREKMFLHPEPSPAMARGSMGNVLNRVTDFLHITHRHTPQLPTQERQGI